MDLIKNGILPEGSTLDDAIYHIMNGAAYGEGSNIAHLDTAFEIYANKFTFTSDQLNNFLDNYDSTLKDISDNYMLYESDKAMVADFEQQLWSDYDKNIKSDKISFEQTIEDFINGTGTGYSKWKTDITTIFQNNKPVVNVSSGQTVDLKNIESLLAQAKNILQNIFNSQNVQVSGTANKQMTYDGRYRSAKTVEINGVTYITSDALDGWYSTSDTGYVEQKGSGYIVKKGATKYELLGYSSGIENGPITYTGLAMLHGSPSNPEYVLNSEQAGTLLKNLATMTINPYQAPKVDSYNHTASSTVYQFNGDMNLPNVQRPDQFFSELLKQANVQFPTIKENYR